MRIAVTGATGYIGGRLVPQLLADGHDVTCLVRNPSKLADRPWAHEVTAFRADLTDGSGVAEALEGCDVAVYLVHSMAAGSGFDEIDRVAASGFARAASSAGVKRIVYLGGLGADNDE